MFDSIISVMIVSDYRRPYTGIWWLLALVGMFVGGASHLNADFPEQNTNQEKTPNRSWKATHSDRPSFSSSRELHRIAFGSCNKVRKPQPLWSVIRGTNPDLWIWLGDTIYADTTNMEKMERLYRKQLKQPEYARFRRSVPIIGVWDDHDYGRNDAGASYPRKEISEELFLDFIGEPHESPRRETEGVYASYTFGPPARRVKIILLDTRYHREPGGKRADILGEKQWTWLRSELSGSKARLHIIGSSIQVIPEQHRYEKWANYPRARKRLFQLFQETDTDGMLLISGDRHFAEMSKYSGRHTNAPIYEVTSSGMTHPWKDFPGEENRYRTGAVFHRKNFGMIRIHWDRDPVKISLEIHDVQNDMPLKKTISLPGLSENSH